MKTKKLRRALSVIIAAVMVFAMVPAVAMAEGISSTVKIVWDDNYDAQEARPAAVKAILSGGTEAVLNAENNWEFTMTDLPEREGGYRWTLYESGLPDGYEVTKTETEGTATTFTISYTASAPGGDTNVISYDLWVNGVQVTEKNAENIPVDKGTAVYNHKENTLTLTNAEITEGYLYQNLPSYNIRKFAGIYTKMDLTIVLNDENTIDLSNVSDSDGICINSDKTLTIEGSGSIDINAKRYGINTAIANTIINEGNITTFGGYGGISNGEGTVTINGGTVKTSTRNNRGMENDKGILTINGGVFEVVGGGFGGIDNDGGTVKVLGGTLKASTPVSNALAIRNGGIIIIADSHGITTPEGGILNKELNDAGQINRSWITNEDGSDARNVVIEPAYKVTIADGITNGTVEADKLAVSKAKADAGEEITVTLTATPASGYMLDKYTVKDAGSGEVTVTDGKFTMPKSDVTVTATFKEVVAYDLWVNGVQVTSDRLKDDEAGWSFVPGEDGKSGTLTLNGVNIIGTSIYGNADDYTAGINSGLDDLTISIKGENYVTNNGSGKAAGIYAAGNIIFSGEGTLNVTSARGYGLLGKNGGSSKLTVNGGTITAKGGNYGIQYFSGGITVNEGGILSAEATNTGSEGISAESTVITISGGELTAKGTQYGVWKGSIIVNSGKFNAEGTNAGSVGFDISSLEVRGGKVEAKGKYLAVYITSSFLMADTQGITTPEGGYRSGKGIYDKNNQSAKDVVIEPVYKVNITEGITNGTVKADKTVVGLSEINSETGATVTLTVTPAEGYMVDTISAGDGVTINTSEANKTYTFIMPKHDVEVTASFKKIIIESVEITQMPDKTDYITGETFDPDGMILTAVYTDGTRAVLTDYQVPDLYLDESVTMVPLAYNTGAGLAEVNIPIRVKTEYTITVPGEMAGGSVTADKETAAEGEEVTLTATPDNGYKLDKLTVTDAEDNEIDVTDGKFLMPASDVTVTAAFVKEQTPGGGGGSGIVSFVLTYNTNGGEKIKSESHKVGDKVTLDKVPTKDGFTFTGWYSDKECTQKIESITMNSSKTVYAGWEESGEKPVDENAPLMKITIGDTKYQLNGVDKEMDAAPFIDENDRTMLPVRVVANALGISDADIAWDNETKTASFTRPDGKVFSCTVGSNIIKIGDEEIEIDTAPVIRNDRIYLPMRALFNAFNVSDAHIIWNGVNKTVTVTKEALEDIKALAEPVEEAEGTAENTEAPEKNGETAA